MELGLTYDNCQVMALASGCTNEKLLERAASTIAEAQKLRAQNEAWRDQVSDGILRMRAQTFLPKSLKFSSPLDFPEKIKPYQPFASEQDGPVPSGPVGQLP